jgi:hypothetical protein
MVSVVLTQTDAAEHAAARDPIAMALVPGLLHKLFELGLVGGEVILANVLDDHLRARGLGSVGNELNAVA